MKLKSLQDLGVLLPNAGADSSVPARPGHDGRGKTVRLLLDRKGRKGKTVTLVTGLQHNPATIEEIARTLRTRCGTGGTVKDGVIELQGDQREKAGRELEAMNYVVR